MLDEDAYARGDPAPCLDFPVQCGHVAHLDPQGRFLCDLHYRRSWHCTQCEAFLPVPERALCSETGWLYCSPQCRAAGEDEGDLDV